ncbi:MAG: PD40 domain-containing protein, partial [Candidatus Eisenbacteria bacterium]|nr:PD40 domain-containing protein [Candidatus Eisenbacteria bacterium]
VALQTVPVLVIIAIVATSICEAAVLNARCPDPSPDGSLIAFSYMGDIWTVPSAGGSATRVTVHDAYDDVPLWSPDGQSLAFSSDRAGNADVYIIPVQCGVPTRLTWHSSWDSPECWDRDGSRVLFTSFRDTLESNLYAVSIDGGLPHTLIFDQGYNCAVSPDGRWLAYVRGRTPWWRQHYRGSAARDIWIRAIDGGPSYRIVHSPFNDDRPMWGADGQTIYFVSEREDSVANIWRIEVGLPVPGEDGEPRATEAPSQVTRHDHDGVQLARISGDGSLIVYEWDAGIWKLSVSGGTPQEVVIHATSDLKWNEDLIMNMSSDVTEFAFSPDETQLAMVMRGEVFVLPFEDGEAGEARRITETAAREKDLAWMPDGETLLFASDRTGDYDIYAVESVEEGEPRLCDALKFESSRLTETAEDEFDPTVSPEGGRIAYMYGDQFLQVMDPDGSDVRRIVPEPGILHAAWSPDSRWIALSRTTMGHKEDVFIVPSEGGEAVNVTDHPNDDFQPRWSDDGKRLSFASRTDDGQYALKYIWLLKEDYWKTDEEREKDAEELEEAMSEAEDGGDEAAPVTVSVDIDFDGINERTVTVMNMRGGYDFYAQTPDGHYYAFRDRSLRRDNLWLVDWKGNRLEQVSQGGSNPSELHWDNDGATCYYIDGGRISTVTIDPESGSVTGRGSVGVSARMTVNVPEERRVMFMEAWRLLWNGFYDPAFHGVDWSAVRRKYEPLAMAAYTEEEFRTVIREMLGELSASHLGIYKRGGGGVTTGRLGVYHYEDYDGPGIRVRKVLPNGPADRAGLAPGDYILSIDGREIGAGENYYPLLEDTNGEEILIEVAYSPGGRDRHDVRIRPSGSVYSQVYEDVVRQKRSEVETLSGGRLGYIHIPGMGQGNLFEFEEDLFAQGKDKDGLIIDIRGNGGGSVHDEILRYLDRRIYGYTVSRGRPESYNPLELYTEPLALVIDESCYSDAEIFPMGWKALELGPVVGTPTYGAVIGTNDVPLIDGTMFRVPGSGWFDLTGKNLENWGIEPDVYVESIPEESTRGEDAQLARAVQVLLDDLE